MINQNIMRMKRMLMMIHLPLPCASPSSPARAPQSRISDNSSSCRVGSVKYLPSQFHQGPLCGEVGNIFAVFSVHICICCTHLIKTVFVFEGVVADRADSRHEHQNLDSCDVHMCDHQGTEQISKNEFWNSFIDRVQNLNFRL